MDNIILQKTWVQGCPVIVDNLLGTAFTGEAQAHTFVVSGVDAAQEPVTITGTITGKFLAANNVTVPLTGSLVNGAASVTLTDECYDVPGRYILSIYATNGSTTQCLYCAVGNVFRTDSQTIAYPSTDLPNITTLMAQLEEILDGWPADYSQLQSDVSNLKGASCQNYVVLAESAINSSGNTFYDDLNGDGEYDFQYYAKVKNGGSGSGYFTVVWYKGTAELKRETVLISNGSSNEFTIPKGTTFTKVGVANTNSLSNCTIYVYGNSNAKLLSYAEQNVLSTLSLVSKTAFLPTLRNGTVGNSSNANGVATDKIYPFGDAKYVKVEINKDKQVIGNQYQIIYTTYSVDNGVTDIASQANRITADAYLPKSDTGIFSNADGSVGFAFAIFEWTSGGAYDPVRKTDFTDDDIVVTYIRERKTIEIGAGKDYAKFSDGLAEAYRLGNCDVIVYPGTYDLVSELGESGLSNNTNYKGLYIGRNIRLTFLDGAKVTCNYTGSVETILTWFSVLRAMDGNFVVENADFDCSNIRYCVHDEKDGVGVYIHEYIDCKMKIDNTDSTWGPHQCIGGGFGNHGIVKVIRGVYESAGISGTDNGVITFHQPSDDSITTFENTLIVDNVYFVNGTAFYSCGGASTKMSDFVCSNCSMLVAPFVNGAGTSATQNVTGYIWNNEIRDN